MAATPEELLGLAEPAPLSPSLFLDLPPTTHGDSQNDLSLEYISRMLTEEDIVDKFFYQYPDHPELLQAEQPFAQILSACSTTAATTSTSNAAAATTWPYDPNELSQLLLLSSSRTNAPAVPAAGPADGGVITIHGPAQSSLPQGHGRGQQVLAHQQPPAAANHDLPRPREQQWQWNRRQGLQEPTHQLG